MRKKIINISQAVEVVNHNLGASWLKENLKKIKNAQGGKVNFGCGIDADAIKTKIACIAYLWYRAQEEIIVANISGQNFTGPYSLTTATIGNDLKELIHCPGLEQKIGQLKNIDSSQRIIFEFSIASGYARAGYPMIFVDDGFIIKKENTRFKCVFMALDSDKKIPVKMEQGQPKTVLYLYMNKDYNDGYVQHDNHGLTDKITQQLAARCHGPVVVFRTGLANMGSRWAMIRKGWIIKKTWELATRDIYVPDESIVSNGY